MSIISPNKDTFFKVHNYRFWSSEESNMSCHSSFLSDMWGGMLWRWQICWEGLSGWVTWIPPSEPRRTMNHVINKVHFWISALVKCLVVYNYFLPRNGRIHSFAHTLCPNSLPSTSEAPIIFIAIIVVHPFLAFLSPWYIAWGGVELQMSLNFIHWWQNH